MAWARIDDNFFNHPKVYKAGKDAVLFHIAALCHSNAFLTEGFIEDAIMDLIGKQAFQKRPVDLANKLVEVELWERVEGGYYIHDFLKYNHSKAEIEEANTKRRVNGVQGGRPAKPRQNLDDNQNVTGLGSTCNEHVDKLHNLDKTYKPIPSHPIPLKPIVNESSSSFESPFIDAYHKATGIEPKKTEEEKAMVQRFTTLGVLPTEYQKAIQEMQEKGYKIASMLSAETWTMNNRNGKKAHKPVDEATRRDKFKQFQQSQGA